MPKAVATLSRLPDAGETFMSFSDPTGYSLAKQTLQRTVVEPAEMIGEAFTDTFMPEMPEIEDPDPVAKESALAAAQAEERSLINRAGLQTTKKVRSLLGREQKLGS